MTRLSASAVSVDKLSISSAMAAHQDDAWAPEMAWRKEQGASDDARTRLSASAATVGASSSSREPPVIMPRKSYALGSGMGE